MAKIAFKVNDNAKKIVQCLNYFTKKAGLMSMLGNAANTNWYYIDYDPETCEITHYCCQADAPSNAIYKEQLPPFMDLPLDIQIEVVSRSRYKSPIPFLMDIHNDYSHGGFNWDSTPEGWEFWSNVLEGDTDLFYKQFKSKQHESRLQEQESPLRGGSREFTSGVRSRVNKARVAVSSLGYKKVVGRG